MDDLFSANIFVILIFRQFGQGYTVDLGSFYFIAKGYPFCEVFYVVKINTVLDLCHGKSYLLL